MNREQINQLIHDVEGWISPDEAQFLYESARAVPHGYVIVEVGSWKGLSTIFLSLGSKDGAGVEIYAVDPHHGANQEFDFKDGLFHTNPSALTPTIDDFMRNIRTYGAPHLVTPIVNFSSYAASFIVRRQINFAFIDAVHNYQSVKTDYGFWYPKVVIGGHMAFHDSINTSFKGSEQAVRECMIDSGLFDEIGNTGCIMYGRKIK